MKIVYYRTLLIEDYSLTPTERIVYSFLVSKSVVLLSEFFDVDGVCYNMSALYESLEENQWLELPVINNSKISVELNISRRTVIRSIKSLEEKGLLRHDCVFVDKKLLERGYIELIHSDILTGELLIFYSYLKDRSRNYCGVIDTYKDKLAECLCTTKTAITKLLNRLYALKLAKRLKNGKLLVL